jgi:hypothetical protein
MELNFGYVALYDMFRVLTKFGMILICRVLIMIYVSFMLD